MSQDAVRSGESEYFRTRSLFGRIEPEARPNECESTTIELYASVLIRTVSFQSDFYMYDTQNGTWLQICEDTAAVGGPRLVFDHQICIDAKRQTIYVFGGRVLTVRPSVEQAAGAGVGDAAAAAAAPAGLMAVGRGAGVAAADAIVAAIGQVIDAVAAVPASRDEYSGLFSYHIPTNTWHELLVDCEHPSASNPDVQSIKARVTHSMLFHERNRQLYILGGQRNKEYTPDILSYNVDTQQLAVVVTEKNGGYECDQNMPQSGFTQRATIDTERDEIYVLSVSQNAQLNVFCF